MIVETLRLKNFRSYESCSVSLNPGMNLFTGANAAGKTNLLESLVYLSLTRSHRINDDSQLIRHDAPYAEIACRFHDGIDKEIGAIIRPDGKTLLLEHQPVRKSSEFVGLLNVVLFAPDDLGVFTDAPRTRRRILNQEITKISPKYLAALTDYQNLLKQRNSLLKNQNVDAGYLEVLDAQMIQKSIAIIHARRAFVKGINRHMEARYQTLADDPLACSLEYVSCIDLADEDIETSLQNLYFDSRQRDLENHVTSIGIHREDLVFELDHRNVTESASQGQKRMVMLAFKMALLQFIEEAVKKKAVFLLDDVLSELDRSRQEKLIELAGSQCQCVITATEIPTFLKGSSLTEFSIENGTIETKNGGTR
ncbi:MAG: DNA replication/repair protein RecF [Solobacterium sp.]|jgi:DNA replication and repair protein RecF|nr:DNA replication/repair protein RecF [Solobacterium sp.]MCH4221881.1 DNA replication/repair protein RecF [Solobacterium sp.]MCH4265204.1 DNA replication/repair protein RecF [Solobacterium sp.]